MTHAGQKRSNPFNGKRKQRGGAGASGSGSSSGSGGGKRWSNVAGSNSAPHHIRIGPGMVGFMVSTVRYKEYPGARELATTIAEKMEVAYPSLKDDIADAVTATKAAAAAAETEDAEKTSTSTTTNADGDETPKTLEEQVAAELDAERAPETEKRARDPVCIVPTGHECLRFIKINDAVATKVVPSDIVRRLFDGIREGKQLYTRFALRCIPFDAIAKSTMDDIAAAIEQLSAPLLGNKQPFAVHTKIRYCPGLDRDALVEKVAKIFIDKEHKVNLSQPVISVVIEVFGELAGVAVIGNSEFTANRKFNFLELKKFMDEQKEKKNEEATETQKEEPSKTEDAAVASTPTPTPSSTPEPSAETTETSAE